MNTLENTSLFTDLSIEESTDINGGDGIVAVADLAGLAFYKGANSLLATLGFNWFARGIFVGLGLGNVVGARLIP